MHKPVRRDFYVDSGLHAAMDAWAKTKKRNPLALVVKFEGEEEFVLHMFKPWVKKEQYKALDGQYYEVEIETAGYEPDFLESCQDSKRRKHGMRVAELRKRISEWLGDKPMKGTFKLITVHL